MQKENKNNEALACDNVCNNVVDDGDDDYKLCWMFIWVYILKCFVFQEKFHIYGKT